VIGRQGEQEVNEQG